MRKLRMNWSPDSVVNLIAAGMAGILVGATLNRIDGGDLYTSVFYIHIVCFSIALMLIQIIAVIMPWSRPAKWALRIALIVAVIVSYRLVLGYPIWSWAA